MIPIELVLGFSAALFAVGLYGILTTRRGLVALMCVEIMLNAANINLVAFSAYSGDALGQAFAIFTIAIAAAEVAVGIALMLNAYKTKGTTDIDELTSMRW
ncbi:MAG: NADH-quinone oxidoreductase subunit NuoK [Thermoplasmatales archaeon]|nr:NADH-quinone oxidoreductase subunit NuoK [Thermoplasmatales archaeon]